MGGMPLACPSGLVVMIAADEHGVPGSIPVQCHFFIFILFLF